MDGKIIDLTLPLYNGMRGVDSEQRMSIEKEGWNGKTWHLYTHAGTHMDAPCHFLPNGDGLETYSVNRFISRAHVVNITHLPPKSLIEVAHLGTIVDNFKSGESLLFYSNWSKKLDTSEYRDGLPRISKELAQWSVDNDVNIIGVEPPSVADVNNMDELREIHHILLKNQIIIVEGLCNLDKIEGMQVEFICLPLSLPGTDGCPVRAIARITL